jgi:pSer/pThr/pTyr-binding forkhead associated (FHA) protein
MARIIHTRSGVVANQYIIEGSSITIGRAAKNKIHINDAVVSALHAEIFIEQNEKGQNIFFLQDLKSKNGSYVNKKKIQCKQLRHKDRIQIGHELLTFIDQEPSLTN